MALVDSMGESRTTPPPTPLLSNAAIGRIAALDVGTLSSEQVLAIANILNDSHDEPTAGTSSSSSRLQMLGPTPPPHLAAASAESLLSRLLTPSANWSWSTADFLSCLTASPTIQSLLRFLLLMSCQQHQPLPPPSAYNSLAAVFSSFLSSLESELSCEMRLLLSPSSSCSSDRLLSSFHVRLYAASLVQQSISRCCGRAAPPGCGSVFPVSSSNSSLSAAALRVLSFMAEEQQKTEEQLQSAAHNSCELWEEGSKSSATVTAMHPLFPADSAEESAPLWSSSSSSSSGFSDSLVFPSFHLPVPAERELLLPEQDEEVESSVGQVVSPMTQPDDLSVTSRCVLFSAVTILQKQQPPPSSLLVSSQQQRQQSVLSRAEGSCAHWSELDVPIFSDSAANGQRSSSSLPSFPPYLLPIVLRSQLEPNPPPPTPPPSPVQSQRKRRRASAELEERERWYCRNSPHCCQFYRKTSSNSIAWHQLNCPHQRSSSSDSPSSFSLSSSQQARTVTAVQSFKSGFLML
jgi:hypothetical protein